MTPIVWPVYTASYPVRLKSCNLRIRDVMSLKAVHFCDAPGWSDCFVPSTAGNRSSSGKPAEETRKNSGFWAWSMTRTSAWAAQEFCWAGRPLLVSLRTSRHAFAICIRHMKTWNLDAVCRNSPAYPAPGLTRYGELQAVYL